MAEMSPLRRRFIEDMAIRNLAPATQQSYVFAIKHFSDFIGRSPARLGTEEVRTYQVHLVSRKLAWGSINQRVAALRFFFGVTLGRPDVVETIPYGREPRRLPVVLRAEEIVRFIEAVANLKYRTALITAYAAGLRVSEVVSLKVAHIETDRMLLRVEQGKGCRIAMSCFPRSCSPSCVTTGARSGPGRDWLFATRGGGHIAPRMLHAACRAACRAARLDNRRSRAQSLTWAFQRWRLPSRKAPAVARCAHWNISQPSGPDRKAGGEDFQRWPGAELLLRGETLRLRDSSLTGRSGP
jgi:site-specific recombinase XerD